MNYSQKQQQRKDLTFGLFHERKTIDIINTKFDVKKLGTFDHFDFRDDTQKIDFELKSRRIYKGQYPTIFFAKHKLITGRKRKDNGETNRVIYLFNFNNKDDPTQKDLYFWEDLGCDDDITFSMGGNWKQTDKPKPLANININSLKPFIECV